MTEIEKLRIEDRPRFAAKLLSAWRWNHMRRGDELSITIQPGEWPPDAPMEIKGVPVVEHETAAGGPGGMLALGRVGDTWRWAFTVAVPQMLLASTEELALVTVFGEITSRDAPMKMWMSPHPETGEVPMWELRQGDTGSYLSEGGPADA